MSGAATDRRLEIPQQTFALSAAGPFPRAPEFAYAHSRFSQKSGALVAAGVLHALALFWATSSRVPEALEPPVILQAALIAPEPLPMTPPEPPKEKPRVEPRQPTPEPRPQPRKRQETPLPQLVSPSDAPSPVSAPPQPPAPVEPVAIDAPPAPPLREPSPAPAPAAAAPAAEPPPAAPPRFNAAYLQNPRPPYPAMSRRLGEVGRVVLRVMVEADGLPSRVEVRRSSGFPRLDDAALEAVKKWKFVPAKRGDEAVAGAVDVPIDFSLSS